MAADPSIDKPPPPLSELHLLLTYECNYKCSHCFVWGGPSQTGTMKLNGSTSKAVKRFFITP
jgi:MoaA/NifB/PqqE/SkfB family radical SAM enzyme